MNKYLALLVFYVIIAVLYFVFDKIEPTAHDGGLGLGGLVLILGIIAVLIYFIIAVVKGFSDHSFFIIALINLIVLFLCAKFLLR